MANSEQTEEGKAKSAVIGLVFFLVLGLAITKDIVDIVLAILEAAAAGLAGTVVGAPIGIPLDFLLGFIGVVLTMFVNFIIATYFFFNKGAQLGSKLAVQSIGAIIDAVPFLSIIPTTTIVFLIAFFIGKVKSFIETKIANKKGLLQKVGGVAKKILPT